VANFDTGATYAAFVDKRRNNRTVGVLNGTQTVANQFQINGPNTGFNPVASVEIGQVVDVVSPTGTVRGSGRTITAISGTNPLTVTYSGADITTDANGDLVVLSQAAETLGAPADYDSNLALETRLVAANSGYWSAAHPLTGTTRVLSASSNDLLYAKRLLDSPGSI
jgi:hypothetical protein